MQVTTTNTIGGMQSKRGASLLQDHECCEVDNNEQRTRIALAIKRRSKSHPLLVGWLLLTMFLCSSVKSVTGTDDDAAFANYYNNYNNGGDDDTYQIDDRSFYYNNGQGNYNQYYNNNYYYGNNDDGNNGNYNNDDGNNGNYNNDDGNNNNNDDGNNGNNNDDANNNNNDDGNNGNNNDDDANNNNNDGNNGNDDGKYYNYEAADLDDAYVDDNIELGVDGFDGVSISPVSCINYNNGHMIKFEMYETANRYQCHFSPIGTFVVSIAHFMRAYFNYQALTQGNSFSLPDDVGYLNCIPLKLEKYGFDYVPFDDGNRRLEEDENQEQAILYAKVGCLTKGTFSSNAFQLHVYTDDKCTEPYDDGQTDQQHASRGYDINLDEFYAANLEEDDAVKYTDYPVNALAFSTKVSFRPSFYSCHTCKPSQISNSFNKFSGTFYDDTFIGEYGMTQSAYNEYLAEQQAQQQANAQCDDCQYFTYNDDDSNDGYNTKMADDRYYGSVDDTISNAFVDDYNNHDDNGGNGRQLRLSSDKQVDQEKSIQLLPSDKEFKKYESEFWKDINSQLENRDRSLYENVYGGVDDWNMCEQLYKYGLYCDEVCQSLDAFRANQWSGADIILLSIMCTFIASMMILVVAKHQRSARMIQKQQSFYSANDYDPNRSGIDTSQIPGLPPMTMLIIFSVIMVTIIILAFFNFVNETLVFAVVCCILLFIYMLKITLFYAPKRPVLLASPNHEDVFGYSNAEYTGKKKGFFS